MSQIFTANNLNCPQPSCASPQHNHHPCCHKYSLHPISTINSSEEQLHIDVEAKTQNAANHHRGELLVAVKTEISNSIDTAPRWANIVLVVVVVVVVVVEVTAVTQHRGEPTFWFPKFLVICFAWLIWTYLVDIDLLWFPETFWQLLTCVHGWLLENKTWGQHFFCNNM